MKNIPTLDEFLNESKSTWFPHDITLNKMLQ